MSVPSPGTSARARNPLAPPLIVVSIIAIIEAILVGVLALRGPHPASPLSVSSASPPSTSSADPPMAGPAPPATSPAPRPAADADADAGVARGKRGQRVDSGGFGITVEEIT